MRAVPLLALVTACVLAAAGRATAGIAVRSVGTTTATVTWDGASERQVEYGLPGRLGLWSAPSENGREAQLSGLLPHTAYAVRLRGETIQFRTSPASSTTTAVGARGAVLLDGSPFIPIMQWLQCPWRFKSEVALGFNVFLGRGCSDTADADEVASLAALGAYSVLPYDHAVAANPALFGWRFGDEPDLDSNHVRPAAIQSQYRSNRAADPTHINFLTVTSGFYSKQATPKWAAGDRSIYSSYAQATDAIGFDLYPITGWCRPDWLPEISDAQRELVAIAGHRPTYQWIEATSTASQWCTGRGVTPAELRSEAWQALIGGAKAVGYFTHSWEPTYTQFRVSAGVQAELRRTNLEIEALAPALLATPVSVAAEPAGEVITLGRRLHGATYVVVANLARKPVRAMLHLPAADRWRGFDTAAQLHLDAGRAVVTLPPLAVATFIAAPAR